MVRFLASPAPQIPWCRPPPECQPQDPGALMTNFEQYLILAMLVSIVIGIVSGALALYWVTTPTADQAEAMWQTIDDECRRMREAGIAD